MWNLREGKPFHKKTGSSVKTINMYFESVTKATNYIPNITSWREDFSWLQGLNQLSDTKLHLLIHAAHIKTSGQQIQGCNVEFNLRPDSLFLQHTTSGGGYQSVLCAETPYVYLCKTSHLSLSCIKKMKPYLQTSPDRESQTALPFQNHLPWQC